MRPSAGTPALRSIMPFCTSIAQRTGSTTLRNSIRLPSPVRSFTYKGKAVDVRQVGRELGVRYVLEGGVRKAGNRMRIFAHLIEAETGAHLWADKWDGALEDIFDLQDKITERVVGIVEPS